MRTIRLFAAAFLVALPLCAQSVQPSPVATSAGAVTGLTLASGIIVFRGIPYAAPPIGDLRWRAPQPPATWTGVRKADVFGAQCMQARIYADMIFRDPGPSEDCLNLNVWTQSVSPNARRPVMVWIYGGGFRAGSSSEPRQDGENLAKKGVVVVSMNYRLGVFGFFVHDELVAESGHGSAGNYGLMDQVAALRWVKDNIAAFGGDPGNVTIFGESAGSFSVSALMASPLAQGSFQRAIGESGSFSAGTALATAPLAQAVTRNQALADTLGVRTLAELRAKPAADVLKAATAAGASRFGVVIDGYLLPQSVHDIFAAGKQSHVPLLAGWNGQESGVPANWTVDNFVATVRTQYGAAADEFLSLYPVSTVDEARRSATDYAGDQFIAYGTWTWIEDHLATGNAPVYRYRFDQAPPPGTRGAYHSAEIEFAFNVLDNKNLEWRDDDRKVADIMSSYWVNFAKAGDPNAGGLPKWPAFHANGDVLRFLNGAEVMPEPNRARYEFLRRVGKR